MGKSNRSDESLLGAAVGAAHEAFDFTSRIILAAARNPVATAIAFGGAAMRGVDAVPTTQVYFPEVIDMDTDLEGIGVAVEFGTFFGICGSGGPITNGEAMVLCSETMYTVPDFDEYVDNRVGYLASSDVAVEFENYPYNSYAQDGAGIFPIGDATIMTYSTTQGWVKTWFSDSEVVTWFSSSDYKGVANSGPTQSGDIFFTYQAPDGLYAAIMEIPAEGSSDQRLDEAVKSAKYRYFLYDKSEVLMKAFSADINGDGVDDVVSCIENARCDIHTEVEGEYYRDTILGDEDDARFGRYVTSGYFNGDNQALVFAIENAENEGGVAYYKDYAPKNSSQNLSEMNVEYTYGDNFKGAVDTFVDGSGGGRDALLVRYNNYMNIATKEGGEFQQRTQITVQVTPSYIRSYSGRLYFADSNAGDYYFGTVYGLPYFIGGDPQLNSTDVDGNFSVGESTAIRAEFYHPDTNPVEAEVTSIAGALLSDESVAYRGDGWYDYQATMTQSGVSNESPELCIKGVDDNGIESDSGCFDVAPYFNPLTEEELTNSDYPPGVEENLAGTLNYNGSWVRVRDIIDFGDVNNGYRSPGGAATLSIQSTGDWFEGQPQVRVMSEDGTCWNCDDANRWAYIPHDEGGDYYLSYTAGASTSVELAVVAYDDTVENNEPASLYSAQITASPWIYGVPATGYVYPDPIVIAVDGANGVTVDVPLTFAAEAGASTVESCVVELTVQGNNEDCIPLSVDSTATEPDEDCVTTVTAGCGDEVVMQVPDSTSQKPDISASFTIVVDGTTYTSSAVPDSTLLYKGQVTPVITVPSSYKVTPGETYSVTSIVSATIPDGVDVSKISLTTSGGDSIFHKGEEAAASIPWEEASDYVFEADELGSTQTFVLGYQYDENNPFTSSDTVSFSNPDVNEAPELTVVEPADNEILKGSQVALEVTTTDDNKEKIGQGLVLRVYLNSELVVHVTSDGVLEFGSYDSVAKQVLIDVPTEEGSFTVKVEIEDTGGLLDSTTLPFTAVEQQVVTTESNEETFEWGDPTTWKLMPTEMLEGIINNWQAISASYGSVAGLLLMVAQFAKKKMKKEQKSARKDIQDNVGKRNIPALPDDYKAPQILSATNITWQDRVRTPDLTVDDTRMVIRLLYWHILTQTPPTVDMLAVYRRLLLPKESLPKYLQCLDGNKDFEIGDTDEQAGLLNESAQNRGRLIPTLPYYCLAIFLVQTCFDQEKISHEHKRNIRNLLKSLKEMLTNELKVAHKKGEPDSATKDHWKYIAYLNLSNCILNCTATGSIVVEKLKNASEEANCLDRVSLDPILILRELGSFLLLSFSKTLDYRSKTPPSWLSGVVLVMTALVDLDRHLLRGEGRDILQQYVTRIMDNVSQPERTMRDKVCCSKGPQPPVYLLILAALAKDAGQICHIGLSSDIMGLIAGRLNFWQGSRAADAYSGIVVTNPMRDIVSQPKKPGSGGGSGSETESDHGSDDSPGGDQEVRAVEMKAIKSKQPAAGQQSAVSGNEPTLEDALRKIEEGHERAREADRALDSMAPYGRGAIGRAHKGARASVAANHPVAENGRRARLQNALGDSATSTSSPAQSAYSAPWRYAAQ